MVPVFLAKYKEKIMHSGKYLNVFRESGRDVVCPFDHEKMLQGMLPKFDDIQEDVEMRGAGAQVTSSQFDFFEPIERAYDWSSQQLLDLIFNECQLVKRLESIKHYFFLDKGDFFLHFVEGSEEILET